VAVQMANALMVLAVPLPRSATVNVWDQGKSAVEATLSVHRKTAITIYAALTVYVCK